MKIELNRPYGFTHIGKKPNNEDTIYPLAENGSNKNSLFIVCDGVGGLEKGEIASAELCASLVESFSIWNGELTQSDLLEGLSKAYARLDALEDPNELKKMGTTLTFLKIHSEGILVAHIGDSRVYHIRPGAENPILYKTRDHSLVQDLVLARLLTLEEAANHPQRNVITRAVQPHQENPAQPDTKQITDVRSGDYFFMCTDGVLENLSDELLVSTLRQPISDKQKIRQIEAICEGKTRDNYSAWLIPVKNSTAENEYILKTVDPMQQTEDPKPTKVQAYSKKNRIARFGILFLFLIVFAEIYYYSRERIVNAFQKGFEKASSSIFYEAKDSLRSTLKNDTLNLRNDTRK